ncbi:hypothetical protein Hanom_Chr00s073579g01789851 [Helianthus anomalus]
MAVSHAAAPRTAVSHAAAPRTAVSQVAAPRRPARAAVRPARARGSFLMQLMLVQLHSAFETDKVNAFD